MKNFLSQNWLWIAIPLVLMAAVVLFLFFGQGDDGVGDRGYQLY